MRSTSFFSLVLVLVSLTGTTHGQIPIPPGARPIGFTSPALVSGGAVPVDVVVVDANGDADLDVATINTSQTVRVVTASGPRTFGPLFQTIPVSPVNATPRAIIAGQLDGAANEDLAVLSISNPVLGGLPAIDVLTSDAAGTFTASTQISLAGLGAFLETPTQSLAVTDLDGDGTQDLAVCANVSSTIVLFPNVGGAGTFVTPAISVAVPGVNPSSIVSGDLDGDGREDLAVCGGSSLAICRNAANTGVYTVTVLPLASGGGTLGLALGDFDGDQDLDLAALTTATVEVFTNDGSGAFTPSAPLPVGFAYAVRADDFNGDGLDDLAVSEANQLSIFRSLPGGAFASDGPIAVAGGNLRGLDSRDIDADGAADLATTPSGTAASVVLFNRSSQLGFTASVSQPCGAAVLTASAPTFGNTLTFNLVSSVTNPIFGSVLISAPPPAPFNVNLPNGPCPVILDFASLTELPPVAPSSPGVYQWNLGTIPTVPAVAGVSQITAQGVTLGTGQIAVTNALLLTYGF